MMLTCGDDSCLNGNQESEIASGHFGSLVTIMPTSDNKPYIFYANGTDFRLAHCADNLCSSVLSNIVIQANPNSGFRATAALGLDGLPIIVYPDTSGAWPYRTKTAKCTNADCSTRTTTTWGTSNGSNGIAVTDDDMPVVFFQDDTFNFIALKCGNSACSTGTTSTPDTLSFRPGSSIYATVGQDGNPFVAYASNTVGGDINALKCGNRSCTAGNTKTMLESNNAQSGGLSVALGADGNPIIAHRIIDGLRVIKCHNASCAP